MAPWRIAGAASLTTTFALMGWQVQGLIDDRGWSSGLMWASVVAGLATQVTDDLIVEVGLRWEDWESTDKLVIELQNPVFLMQPLYRY